ncbi:YhfC family intramembrane metalloprotease [Salinicoccus sp. ID82-1]|uniref:YhfC family intramembrane metalloprotease n=1 Tax=Salinicoccus sp. ID82-1 TaxID=2820269 RepID=UPI001F271F55|nr:YhfC family glutamic-type intramembrane protease [Salinicoccus sp. ID82-1]MCG1010369.1 YhfC family intramembrane metalloprotease [Salinicoccus sp. ID82-1]
MVSTGNIIIMGLVVLASLMLPFIFILVLRKRFQIQWVPILIGAATFIVFAMVLEQIAHFLVLRPGVDGSIALLDSSPWLYVLYGVLAAGIFEETGRLVAFLLMKRKYRQIDSAVSYGVGHGGVEAIIVLGLSTFNVLILSILVNNGSGLLNELPAGVLESITGAPGYMYIIGIFERILAISLHIGLSVIVFVAVMQKGKWYLFPLAIVLHALANVTAAMMQAGLLANLWMVYVGLVLMVIITLSIAYMVGSRCKHSE